MNVVTPIGIDLGKRSFQWNIASTVMALRRRAVVAVRDGFARQGGDSLSRRRATPQMSRVFGGFGFMHLPADDLAAVEIQYQMLGKLAGLMVVCPVLLPSEQCSAGQHCADLAPPHPDSF